MSTTFAEFFQINFYSERGSEDEHIGKDSVVV